jgi:hypothetical protein
MNPTKIRHVPGQLDQVEESSDEPLGAHAHQIVIA